MKKLVITGMLFLTMFALTGQAIAQCPTGYAPMQINVRVNDCLYKVDLCVYCPPFGFFPGAVMVRGFMQIPENPACTQTLNVQEVLDYLEAHVTNPDFYYASICQSQYGTPPCPDNSQPIELRHPSCWHVEMISFGGQEVLYYSSCGPDAYCWEKIAWCKDPVTGLYNRIVLDGPTQIGTPSCTDDYWEITEPTELGQISDCFIMHNICNP